MVYVRATCSPGWHLQWSAALRCLGRDDQGAKQVNLDITDRPSDVYTFVADMVEKQIEKDLEKGEKYAQMLAGKYLGRL